MASLHPDVLDDGLNVLTTSVSALHICSQEPTTYAEATSTYTLGDGAASAGSPADKSGGGREVTVGAISGGSVTATGTATHYAVVDGTRLLGAEALSSSQSVTSGNTFDLGAFTIGIPGAV